MLRSTQHLLISLTTLLLIFALCSNVQGSEIIPLSKFQQNSQIFLNRKLVATTKKKDMDDDFENDDDDGNNNDDGALEKHNLKLDTCKPLSQCELCPTGYTSKNNNNDSMSGCKMTGKRIHIQCELDDDNVNREGSDIVEKGFYKDGNLVTLYTSCKRTVMDEEYLMMQLQAVCVFVALISLRSVKREKIASASLFELRSRRRIRQQQQQEMIPLTNNNNNDVGNGNMMDGDSNGIAGNV